MGEGAGARRGIRAEPKVKHTSAKASAAGYLLFIRTSVFGLRPPSCHNEFSLPASIRILALDLGKKRIGLAISDPLGITAQGLPNLVRTNKRADLEALGRIAAEREAGMVLLGNPLNMRGDEGRQSGWVKEFAAAIEERLGLPVRFWDERLTSVEAERVLRSSGISIEK